MYSKMVCLSGDKQAVLIIRFIGGWFEYKTYSRMVSLAGV